MRGRHYLLPALLFTTACTASNPADREERPSSSSGIVIQGSELSGNLLESLRGRVGAMTIAYAPGECPRITFRGVRSIRNQANPGVYVDGTMMLDTCILQQISTNDIDFVEVFPSGQSSRVGIQRHPFGLILVFRRRE